MRILAFDLGDFNALSAWNFFDEEEGEISRGSALTTEADLCQVIRDWHPDVVLCEACLLTHLLVDAGAQSGMSCQVIAANTNADAWRWHKTKLKTDDKDCDRLIKLFRLGEIEEVFIPDAPQRELRRLIMHRGNIVSKRTASYNAIRSICKRHQIKLQVGERAWSEAGLAVIESLLLRQVASAQVTCADADIWRIELQHHVELVKILSAQLKQVEGLIQVELKKSPNGKRLQTVPGVGPQIAAALIAFIGSAKRFPSGKQVAAYLGLVPRIYQSGKSERHGGITKAGNQRVRKLLVNGAWQAIRHDPWAKALFERLTGGSTNKERRKKAIVAVARRMAIRCWAIMRDGTTWDPPAIPS